MQWQLIDYFGALGGVLLFFAFWRTSTGIWKVSSPWYELDNVVGCIILIFYAWQKHAYVSIILNVIWAVVAFRGLSSFTERRLMRNPDYNRGFRKGRNSLKRHKKH